MKIDRQDGMTMPVVEFHEYEYRGFTFLGRQKSGGRFPFIGLRKYSDKLKPIIEKFSIEEYRFRHELQPGDLKIIEDNYKDEYGNLEVYWALNTNKKSIHKQIWRCFCKTSAILKYHHILPYLQPDEDFGRHIQDKYIYLFSHCENNSTVVKFSYEFKVEQGRYIQKRYDSSDENSNNIFALKPNGSSDYDSVDNNSTLKSVFNNTKSGNSGISLPLIDKDGRKLQYYAILSQHRLSDNRIEEIADDISKQKCHIARKLNFVKNSASYIDKYNFNKNGVLKNLDSLKSVSKCSIYQKNIKNFDVLNNEDILEYTSIDIDRNTPIDCFEDLTYRGENSTEKEQSESSASHIFYLVDHFALSKQLEENCLNSIEKMGRSQSEQDAEKNKKGEVSYIRKGDLKALYDCIVGITTVGANDNKELVAFKKQMKECLETDDKGNYLHEKWHSRFESSFKLRKVNVELSGYALASIADTKEFNYVQYNNHILGQDKKNNFANGKYYEAFIDRTGDIALTLLQSKTGQTFLREMSEKHNRKLESLVRSKWCNKCSKCNGYTEGDKIKKCNFENDKANFFNKNPFNIDEIYRNCYVERDWFTPILILKSPVRGNILAGFSAVFCAYIASMPNLELVEMDIRIASQTIKIKKGQIVDGKVLKPANYDKIYDEAQDFGKKILKKNGNYLKKFEVQGGEFTTSIVKKKPVYVVAPDGHESNMNLFAGKALGLLGLGLSVYNLNCAFKGVDSISNLSIYSVEYMNVMSGFFGLISSIAGFTTKLFLKQSMIINIVSSSFDLYQSTAKVQGNIANNDYDAAIFNSLASVAAAGSIGTACWVIGGAISANSVAGAASGAVGGGGVLSAPGAVAGAIIGAIFGVMYGTLSYFGELAKDTKIESWIKHCYWGEAYENDKVITERVIVDYVTDFYKLIYCPEVAVQYRYHNGHQSLGVNIIPKGLNNNSLVYIKEAKHFSHKGGIFPLNVSNEGLLVYNKDVAKSNCDVEIKEIKKGKKVIALKIKAIKMGWISSEIKVEYFKPIGNLAKDIKSHRSKSNVPDFSFKIYIDIRGDGRYVFSPEVLVYRLHDIKR